MSIVQEILYIVSNYPGGYRTIYDILYNSESPEETKDRHRRESTLKNTLSRLRRNGLVRNEGGKWSLSPEGKEFLESKNSDIKKFFPNKQKVRSGKKQLIVIFDIPEKERRFRDWLRSELVGFGFEPIQKSVWLGPNLPEDFLGYLHEINLLKNIKFFKATEEDLI